MVYVAMGHLTKPTPAENRRSGLVRISLLGNANESNKRLTARKGCFTLGYARLASVQRQRCVRLCNVCVNLFALTIGLASLF